jgi:hypothetical protein
MKRKFEDFEETVETLDSSLTQILKTFEKDDPFSRKEGRSNGSLNTQTNEYEREALTEENQSNTYSYEECGGLEEKMFGCRGGDEEEYYTTESEEENEEQESEELIEEETLRKMGLSDAYYSLFYETESSEEEGEEEEELSQVYNYGSNQNVECSEDKKAYEGCELTVHQALLILLQFIVSASLSKSQMIAFFSILKQLLPYNNSLNPYLNFRAFYSRFNMGDRFKRLWFCDVCNRYCESNKKPSISCECGKQYSRFYFIRDPIEMCTNKLNYKKIFHYGE